MSGPRVEFVCAGGQKCGTTSLHWYLFGHPGLVLPGQKELHYFSNDGLYEKGAGWYEGRFAEGGKAGEVCPDYMYFGEAAGRMKAYNAGMKVVVVVRDPVERALSQYGMEVERGNEGRGLEEALWGEKAGGRWGEEVHSYRERGRYAEQLKRLADAGLAVRVWETGRMLREPRAVVEEVVEWLGAPLSYEGYEFRRYRVGETKVECPERVRERLVEEFRPWNERLGAEWGVDVGGWAR